MEARIERERSSEEQGSLEPYFVYFPTKKGIDAEPILVLAPNAVVATEKARATIAGGVKKRRALEVIVVGEEKFRAKAKELLEGGRRLPRAIIDYAGLWELVRELREETPFSRF